MLTFFVFVAVVFTTSVFAQSPPSPPSGGHYDGGTQEPGGGAPLDDGLDISLAMAAGFGAWKLFMEGKKKRTKSSAIPDASSTSKGIG